MAVLQNTNKKKAAAIGVAAIAAATLALGAGTYAAFSDTETGPEATFAAGTLDLTVGGVATTSPTSLTNVAPGSVIPLTFQVDNVGSIDGTLSLGLSLISSAENGCAEPESQGPNAADTTCDGAGELPANLEVYYGTQFIGTVADLTAQPAQSFPIGSLPATEAPRPIAFEVRVKDAGNEIMTDSAVIAVTASLTQS